MHFFDLIPESLFTILASKNKRIYMDALFVVWECFKYELSVSRNHLLSALIANMESEIYALVDEDDSDDMISTADLSSKGNFLIRKLVETSWLSVEMRSEDFENMLSLPDYSQKLLDVLQSLMNQRGTEYNGLVVSSYNNLKATDIERGDYAFNAINRAVIDTEHLIDRLKSLYHNIGRYHQLVLEQSDVNTLLATHFDDFQEVIVAQFLFPFKTFDSVPRFKGPILEILNKWYQDEGMIALLVDQAMKYLNIKDMTEANNTVIQMISKLIDMYEGLQGLIAQIDQRHNAFTRVSVEKIQYLLNRDASVKGNLVSLLQALAQDTIKTEDVNSGIAAFRQSFVDSSSLYARSRIQKSRVMASSPIKTLSQEERSRVQADFVDQVKESYGREMVIKEIEAMLQNGQVAVSDMPLENDKDFARIILASLIGAQDHAPFKTAFSKNRYQKSDYDVPENSFKKKGKRNGMD